MRFGFAFNPTNPQARASLERAKAIQPYDVGPGGRFREQRLALGVTLGTVRVSAGLEHPDDLLEDFRQALAGPA